MSKRKDKLKRKAFYEARMGQVLWRWRTCINCKCKTDFGHFVPPSFGEEGFFICTPAKDPECALSSSTS